MSIKGLTRNHWYTLLRKTLQLGHIFSGTQALLVVRSSLWLVQRITWSTCGHYMTSLVVTRRTFHSRKGRSLSFWKSQRNNGGVPKIKMDASGWSPCPTWRNWYDPPPILASLPTARATPTATVSRSHHTPLLTPMPSPRPLPPCPPAHPEQSLPRCPPCRMVLCWQRPFRSVCPVPTTKLPLL